MKRNSGFTLIEISIVLVIIGLIVGGVLVGRDLIQIAQSRKLMSQMEQVQAAANTFRLKYDCKAGDCANATQFGLGANGNGDGLLGATDPLAIAGAYGGCLWDNTGSVCLTNRSTTATLAIYNRHRGEPQYFWLHLSAAGFISDSISAMAIDNAVVTAAEMPSYFPKDALGKYQLSAFTWNGRLYIRTGLTDLRASKTAAYEDAVLNAAQANYITSKFGYTPIGGMTSNYLNALAQGQRVVPLGIRTDAALGIHFNDATLGTPAGTFTPCLISDGAGGHKYDLAAGGSCNLMWQIDY